MYRGEQYDSRVDIYALGLVLYKLMNHNRLPFLNLEKQLITYRDKENALTRRMSGETPPAPVDAGEAFGSVILKACAYDAKERYQTPDKFREALEEIRYGTANREQGVHEKPKPVEERPVPESMPKFLQEGAARQLARTSQLNTEAIRQARRNPAPVSVQPEKPTAGEIAKNAARNRPKAQSTIQNPQKSASGKTVSERDSLSGYQSGFSRQPEPGIRKTGAVKPRVTSITDLEDDRDQNLQEWEGSVSENGGNTDDGKRRKGIFRMLIAAGIIVVLIGGIIAVRTIRKPSDNGEPSYTDSDDSDALNKGNFGTVDDADKSFAQAMETIRDHATTIENALDSYRREGTEGDRLRFYNGSGEIAKVLVYPGSSADGVYEEYFYWGEQMFYTYVWDGDEKQYFYYQDGLLIRWIDADGKVHDKESDNDKYVELGDKYWSNSVMELQQ